MVICKIYNMKLKTDRLKEIREENNLLQKDVAKILKISQVQYSRYETGIRLIPIDKIAILADYYNTNIDYLLYRTDNKKPYQKSIMN